jgi:MYXO-CTERM domain-containing protein
MLHRSLAVAAIAGGLAAPSIAAACQPGGMFLGTHLQVARGCPVHVFISPLGMTPFPPRLTALRNGVYVDVTDSASSTSEMRFIPVETSFIDCNQRVTKMMNNEPFMQFSLVPRSDVQVGERIGIGEDWFGGLEVLPAGACTPVDVPMIACTEGPPCGGPGFPPFDDIDGGGCAASTGGGAALPAGLLALLVARRRRQR